MEGEFRGPLWCGGLPLRARKSYKKEPGGTAVNRPRTIIATIVDVAEYTARQYPCHQGHCKHPCMPSLSRQPATRHRHLRATPPLAMGLVYPGHRMSSGNHTNDYEFGRDRKHMRNCRLHSPRHPLPGKLRNRIDNAGSIEPPINRATPSTTADSVLSTPPIHSSKLEGRGRPMADGF